ncbi:MAG: hypothetical protein M1472_00255 [Planctomycetes bacterium]|nr:hypothetical protein [Planctomycetota bacterium]MDA8378984.1 hypothetical protein [Planctomycetia bacterium]
MVRSTAGKAGGYVPSSRTAMRPGKIATPSKSFNGTGAAMPCWFNSSSAAPIFTPQYRVIPVWPGSHGAIR